MHLLQLLRAESTIDLRRLLFVATVAGLSNALVLAVINSAAGTPHGAGLRSALIFLIVLALYTISQRYLLSVSAEEIERILHRVRTRLIEDIRHCELPEIEAIGRSRIYDAVSKEIQSLAQSTNVLVIIMQMVILVIFTTLYLITLSMTAFLLAAGFIAVAAGIYLIRTKSLQQSMEAANASEGSLHELLIGVLDGFKEIKLNRQRSDELSEDVVSASLEAGRQRGEAKVGYARNFVFTQDVLFILLGTMVFIVPELSQSFGAVAVKTTTAILFVFGPISGIVSAVPIYAAANASAAGIMQLERLLAERNAERKEQRGETRARFKEIALKNIRFTYTDHGQQPFTVGPLNLRLRAGETLFISGGNGSGKSTLLKLLTALYWPDGGSLSVDDEEVTHENVDAYRSLFSSVFSDYHLFKRLYGIDPVVLPETSTLLEDFEVSDKTRLDGDAFSTIDLSDGQRKRLALIVAMLEHRPICVLDEWAADQDPIFRKRFYHELLRTLKARGITVIAVTHDDRYFDVADRRIQMDEGRLINVVQEGVRA